MIRTVLLAAGVLAVLLPAPGSEASSPACSRPLSLVEVLERVRHGPRAAAAREEAGAQTDVARQAGARPNPELRLELEDFTGSGSYADLDRSQTTLSLSQKIELGGVRDRRVESATREGEALAARARGEQARAEATAKQRYVELVASVEALAIAREAEGLAQSFLADAERREASAAGSAADVARARIAAGSASLATSQKNREFDMAAQRLVASWGGAPEEAVCLAVPASGGLPDPAGRVRAPDTGHSTEVALAEAEVASSRAAASLARASAAPDLEIGAGLRHLAPDDVSAVAELRVELPFFDRNEGAIAAADRRVSAAQHRAAAVRGETEARIARLEATLEAAAERFRTIANTMLPAAEDAARTLLDAWRAGTVSGQEFLTARKTVVELQLERLGAAGEYYRTLAALEGVAGRVSPVLAPARPVENER